MSPFVTWILTALGIAAAISACIQSVLTFDKTKVSWPKTGLGLIVAAAVLQVAIHGMNAWTTVHAASEAQKKAEREVAFALWAFAEQRPNALEKLTVDYPYLYGYYHFKKDTPEDHRIARGHFRNSLARGLFIAPANYILAVMTPRDGNNDAVIRKHLEDGIRYDQNYSPLYVARALEAIRARDYVRAVADFRTAVDQVPVHCLTINETLQMQISTEAWDRLNGLPTFRELAADCAAMFKPNTPKQPTVVSVGAEQ